MELDARQRRDLLALLCRVAWADGSVVAAERVRLLELLERLGQGAVSVDELDGWLAQGPPRVMGPLPPEAKDLFVKEAMGLVAVDCDVDPAEMRVIREVINYYFTRLDELMIG